MWIFSAPAPIEHFTPLRSLAWQAVAPSSAPRNQLNDIVIDPVSDGGFAFPEKPLQKLAGHAHPGVYPRKGTTDFLPHGPTRLAHGSSDAVWMCG